MKFSIVIPSYGQAEFLEQAIHSALQQTWDSNDYEIVVVDDGSTDGSLEIARKYSARVKVISQINKGLASARNTGIMNAKGEYIVFLDADDLLFPTALTQAFYKILNTGADVVGFSIRCFDGKGGTTDTILMPEPKFEDFKEGNRMAYCSAIKRSTLLEVGGYSPRYDSLGGWEDLALWYDLLSRGKKIVTVQEPMVMYRVKEQSMWKDAEKNKAALWAQITKDFPGAKDHAKS